MLSTISCCSLNWNCKRLSNVSGLYVAKKEFCWDAVPVIPALCPRFCMVFATATSFVYAIIRKQMVSICQCFNMLTGEPT